MKKLLLSLVAVLTITTASAQEFGWGVKAGVNLASAVGGDVDGVTSKADFVGGLFVEYKTAGFFAVSLDALYSGQGVKYKDTDARLDLSYLNIPILANFYIGDNFAIKAGIQPGFLLGAKVHGGGESGDVKSLFTTFDLAIPVGVSYQLDCGLLFDLRYNIGLTKLGKGDAKEYNSVFALTVGWKF